MKSSLGFHTMTLFLTLRANESSSLIADFFQYSHDTSRIIIEMAYKDGTQKRTKPFSMSNDNDGIFPKPLETIITYRQDIGIKWRIISKRNDPNFNSYTVEVKINPKILSGINDYLTAATMEDMKVAISNFNQEAKRISPLLQDFSCYKLSRVDYCINLSLEELVPNCTPQQVMNLIRRSNIPPSYREWIEYDEIAHRYKSRPSSFYLINKSVNINIYSKYLQLIDQSKKNIEKGFPPVSKSTLDAAWDILRFEVQCKYHKAYSLSQIATHTGNHNINKYETLLTDDYCSEIINYYYNKTIGLGHWYSLQAAISLVKSHHYNKQKENRLITTLQEVNQCRSLAKAKELHQGHDSEAFKRSLNDLASIGVNPVTIPKDWGVKRIWNLLETYYSKVSEEQSNREFEEDFLLNYKDYIE